MWLFNNGPAPNEWEAVAYPLKNGSTLLVVLSARARKLRDQCLPALAETVSSIGPLDVANK